MVLMMTFHQDDDIPVYVNPAHVVTVEDPGTGAEIQLANGKRLAVKEPIADVLAALQAT